MKYLKFYEDLNSEDEYYEYGKEVDQIAKKLGEKFKEKGYRWEKGLNGMPIDIKSSDGKIVFSKTPDGSSYCTGFSFCVFIMSLWNKGKKFVATDIKKFQKEWNQGNASERPKLCVDAIVKNKLGEEKSLEEAESGDFIQFWRKSGSGHSAILLEKIKLGEKIVGLKYYTSNKSTNGPGVGIEKFSDSGGSVLRENTYFARLK